MALKGNYNYNKVIHNALHENIPIKESQALLILQYNEMFSYHIYIYHYDIRIGG